MEISRALEQGRLTKGICMAKHLADSASEDSVQSHLAQYPGLNHLRVRRRGDLLTLESGPKDNPFPHARFRRDTVHLWRLEMPAGGSKRWEKTPMRASLDELLDQVIDSFPWILSSPYENPVRT
jgi:hypothetical protein